MRFSYVIIAVFCAMSSGCVSCDTFPQTLDAEQDLGPIDEGVEPDAGIDLGEVGDDLGEPDLGEPDLGALDFGELDLGEPDMGESPDTGPDAGDSPDIPDLGPACGTQPQNTDCLGASDPVMDTSGGGGPDFCVQDNLPSLLCEDFSGGLDGWCNGQSLWWSNQIQTLSVLGGVATVPSGGGIHIPLPRFCGGFILETSFTLTRGASGFDPMGGGTPDWTAMSFMLLSSENSQPPEGPFRGMTIPDTILNGYYIRFQDSAQSSTGPDGGVVWVPQSPVQILRFFALSSQMGDLEHGERDAFISQETIEDLLPAGSDPYQVELYIRFDPDNAAQPWVVRVNQVGLIPSGGDNSIRYTGPFDYLGIKGFKNQDTGQPVGTLDHIVIRPF